MDTLLSNLIKLQGMVEQVLSASSGPNAKRTKSGKLKKVSDRKGKPSARNDFNAMICKEKAAELEAFKATLVKKQGAHFTFIANYNKENPEAFPAFEAKWQAQQQQAQQQQAQQQQAQQQAVASPKPSAVPVAAPAATPSAAPIKKPVKTAKKAITTSVVAQMEIPVADELLPFTIGDKTFLRLGTRRENGNHLWTSGHLWMSKKGAKGGHYGELREDGTINMEAEEPNC
jgi:hypothetical protein